MLVGDEIYRYERQAAIDRLMLDLMKDLRVKKCILRPHPQEMTRPNRVSYYEMLRDEYDFIEISNEPDPLVFLEKISLVVSYVESTLVQEALLCNRPVLCYNHVHNDRINQRVLDLSDGLGVGVSSGELLKPIC